MSNRRLYMHIIADMPRFWRVLAAWTVTSRLGFEPNHAKPAIMMMSGSYSAAALGTIEGCFVESHQPHRDWSLQQLILRPRLHSGMPVLEVAGCESEAS